MKRYIFFVLLLLPLATGLQISPASTTIFDQDSFTIRIINDEAQTQTMDLSIDGVLSEYLRIQQPTRTVAAGDSEQVRVTVQRPISLQPGVYTSLLIVDQRPPQEQRTVSTTPSVAHVIEYIQPREGQWLRARLSTNGLLVDAPATFNIHLQQTGTQPIAQAQATLRILENDQVIHQESFSEEMLEAETRFSTEWTPQRQGEYFLEANIEYADKTIRLQEPFTVGMRTLRIHNITHTIIEERTRISVLVENTYNQEFEQVEALFATQQSEARSPLAQIPPGTNQTLSAFLEERINASTPVMITIRYPPNTIRTEYVPEQTVEPRGFPWLLTIGILALIILIYLRIRTLRTRGEDGKE